MNIKDRVFSVVPRENSGPMASNRFDFQKNWAITKILELHAKPGDYLVSFEYHDDIIVFDSSSDPKKISFYQVKTKTEKAAHWTVNALIKRESGKKGPLNSFMGKLYDNIIKHNDDVLSLTFVTNSRIKGKLSNDVSCADISGFCCNQLCDKDLSTIIDALKAEHSLNDLGNFKNIMFFKLGELDINHHDQLAKAQLADFIDSKFPGAKYQIVPLYKSIFDEVRKKSNVEEVIVDFETLKRKKSISRDDFDKYLEVVTKNSSIESTMASIEGRLNAEQVSVSLIKTFKRYAKLFEVERMNYANRMLKTVIDESNLIVKASACDEATLWATLDCLFAEVKKTIAAASFIEDDYLRTILLFHFYEQ